MLLLALVPHVAQLAQQTCALADPPFRVRAVRKREGIWTADVFLRSTWLPGANVSLRWSSVAPPTSRPRRSGRRACKYVWVCQGLYGHVGIRIQISV